MEGAGVVALTSVHISSLSIHYHRVIGETFNCQIDVFCYFLLVVVGIVSIYTVEFVSRERIAVVVFPDIAGVVSVEGDVAMSVVGILEVPSAYEFGLIDR